MSHVSIRARCSKGNKPSKYHCPQRAWIPLMGHGYEPVIITKEKCIYRELVFVMHRLTTQARISWQESCSNRLYRSGWPVGSCLLIIHGRETQPNVGGTSPWVWVLNCALSLHASLVLCSLQYIYCGLLFQAIMALTFSTMTS